MSKNENKQLKRVVIQGGYGAFHEIAAHHYFEPEHIEIIPANTFKDLFRALESDRADLGIMAIENSLAGSLLPNYQLLQDSNMEVIGEIYLRIKQNLVALPGVKISELKEVYSHPMAILQCQYFFDQYPEIKLVESIDTALSAKDIADQKVNGMGAICSKLAAEKYGLEILAESIETNKMNYTRFLILTNQENYLQLNPLHNKASLTFILNHQAGSLSKVLTVFSDFGINLTKIQSMPIMGKDWEYQFYIDVTFDDYLTYQKSLEVIKQLTSKIEVMGEYFKGKTVME